MGELHPAGRVLHVTLDEACLLVRQGGCSLVHTDDAAIIAAALRRRLTSKRRLGSRLWRWGHLYVLRAGDQPGVAAAD